MIEQERHLENSKARFHLVTGNIIVARHFDVAFEVVAPQASKATHLLVETSCRDIRLDYLQAVLNQAAYCKTVSPWLPVKSRDLIEISQRLSLQAIRDNKDGIFQEVVNLVKIIFGIFQNVTSVSMPLDWIQVFRRARVFPKTNWSRKYQSTDDNDSRVLVGDIVLPDSNWKDISGCVE